MEKIQNGEGKKKGSSEAGEEEGSGRRQGRAGHQTPGLVGSASDDGEGVALMDGAAARGGDGLDGWWYMEVLVDGGRGGVVARPTPAWLWRRPKVEKEKRGEMCQAPLEPSRT